MFEGTSVEDNIGSRELGFSKEFLISVLDHSTFISHISVASNHAVRNLSEAGFTVRNVNGNPVISELIKSPPTTSLESMERSFTSSIPMYRTGLPEDGFFPGIVALIHSHPYHPNRDSAVKALTPSQYDLEEWEELKITMKNKNLIMGILATDRFTSKLILIQDDPNREQNTHYQQWDEQSDSADELLRLLQKSGKRYEILNFNLKTKQFQEEDK